MKKYTVKQLKEKWVEFVEEHPVDENYNVILSFICSLASVEERE